MITNFYMCLRLNPSSDVTLSNVYSIKYGIRTRENKYPNETINCTSLFLLFREFI